jgi:amino acid transporter
MSHKAPALQPGDTGGGPVARRGLRSNSLTLGPVVALGLAYMSLAPAVYFNMGFMEADANGPVMPLVFIVVTVAILPTALSFAALNRRRPSAGSALTWVSESLGLPAGLWSGFLLATLYVCACAIYPAYMAIFFNPLLEYFHADATFVTGLAGGIGATILVAWMLARNIQLSARAIAVFMAFEAAFVLVFSLYTVFFQVGHGGIAHPGAPLNPGAAKAGFSGLSLAVVFGILSIAGVDSVAPVAEEARTPKRMIPLATILVTLGAGLFWTISSYGFATAVPVATVEKYVSAGLVTPVYGIAAQYIGGWKILVPITGMTATIASFGASVVCASRLMYSVSRTSGDDSRRIGQVHRKHDIPWNASLVAIVVAFIAPVVVAIWQGHNSSNAAGWLGGVFVFFALVAYMMVNLANIVYHLRHARAEFNWFMNGLVPVLGIVIDGYILYRAFFVAYMQESFQLGKSIVFLSIAWTLIGAIWAVLRGTRQQAGLAARARVHATAEGD